MTGNKAFLAYDRCGGALLGAVVRNDGGIVSVREADGTISHHPRGFVIIRAA